MKPKAQARGAAVEKPVPNTPVEMVEIKGRVVAPDGRPVAGALVTTLYLDTEVLSIDASTDPMAQNDRAAPMGGSRSACPRRISTLRSNVTCPRSPGSWRQPPDTDSAGAGEA